jgi:hypothetical protein
MKGDRIVRIVDIGGFDDHHCFNYLFTIALSAGVVLHIVMFNTLSSYVSLCF